MTRIHAVNNVQTQEHQPERSGAIAACVLLAGGLRPSALVLSTGRNVLDMYVTETRSVLDLWLVRLSTLGSFPVRVVHGGDTPAPTTPPREGWEGMSIEREPQGYRGPAGILRDLCADYPGETTVLVGEAARFVSCDIGELLREHRRRNADATVAMNPDGSPAGLYAIRRSALDCVNRVGFMDLKEQWLAKVLANGGAVFAHPLRGSGAMPLRMRTELLDAARVAAGSRAGSASVEPVSIVRGAASTSPGAVVCVGARVASSAILHDAVVMPGAEVGEDAVVVRSIIAPGVRVEKRSELIDVVAGTRGVRSDQWASSSKRIRVGQR